MKTSFYNYEWREGPYLLLYNAATDQVAVLRPETAALYDGCRQRPDELAERHKEFYDYLCGNGFLVPDGTDEPQAVVRRWQSDEAADRTFMVTVNPTLDCNMQCWYCYEKHERRMDRNRARLDGLRRRMQESAQRDFSFILDINDIITPDKAALLTGSLLF